MGIWLYLKDPETGETLEVPEFMAGSVLHARANPSDRSVLEAISTNEACIAITYNYSSVLKLVVPDWDGMARFFDGRTAAEMEPILADVVEKCGTKRFTDYWAPTPGNVGYIMAIILEWCRLHPEGIFKANG